MWLVLIFLNETISFYISLHSTFQVMSLNETDTEQLKMTVRKQGHTLKCTDKSSVISENYWLNN